MVLARKEVRSMSHVNKKNQINSILISISLVALSGLLVNIANMVTILVPTEEKMIVNLVLYIVACMFGLAILPYLFVCRVIYNGKMPKCNVSIKRTIVISLVILIIFIVSMEKYSLIHNLVIATTEEVLFRYIIISILLKCFDKKRAFIIGSLIFSLILHMNGNFIINFVTKLPASLLLYYLADKYGIQDSIFLHWGYNSLVGYLMN